MVSVWCLCGVGGIVCERGKDGESGEGSTRGTKAAAVFVRPPAPIDPSVGRGWGAPSQFDPLRWARPTAGGVRAKRMGRFDRVGGERGEGKVSQGGGRRHRTKRQSTLSVGVEGSRAARLEF